MTTMILAPFPDAELVMMDLLRGHGQTVTATPPDTIPDRTIRWSASAADDGVTDRPRVQVTCFGITRQGAWKMTREVQQTVLPRAARWSPARTPRRSTRAAC